MAYNDLTPAEQMLYDDGYASKPKVYRVGCYICEDADYVMMGLPLCRPCPKCGGHIAADDSECDDCDYSYEDGLDG